VKRSLTRAFLFLSVLAVTACSGRGEAAKVPQGIAPIDILDSGATIAFDSSISPKNAELIRQDLAALSDMEIEDPDGKIRETLELEPSGASLRGSVLVEWIASRVRYFVGEGFNVKDRLASVEEGFRYEPRVFGQTQAPGFFSAEDGSANIQDRILAENLGAAIYSAGKKNNQLVAVEVAGQWILANSPRVGVIRLRDRFFDYTNIKNLRPDAASLDTETQRRDQELRAMAGMFSRLSTLFHEARHSDGNGENVGFPHRECPKKKDSDKKTKKEITCDVHSNGPHEIEHRLLAAFIKTVEKLSSECAECSTEVLLHLTGKHGFAARSVVDRERAAAVDSRPERVYR
jgi:hypothetical protein